MDASQRITVAQAQPENLAGLAQLIRLPPLPEGTRRLEADIIRFYGELGRVSYPADLELGICAYRKRPLLVDQLEHHASTQELLYAIDDDFIMPMAPDRGKDNVPDAERIIAIRVKRGEGVIFGKGVWHWVPYPLKEESFALVGFAWGTAAKDMTVCRLERKVEMVCR
jgi:hypothetical protein